MRPRASSASVLWAFADVSDAWDDLTFVRLLSRGRGCVRGHAQNVLFRYASRDGRFVSLRYDSCLMPGRSFTTLLDHAQRQYGYLTPEDARKLGVDPTQLRLMAARHTLEHLGHGLYRMPMVPVTQLDAYMEAILWTGRRGVLSHETALDLYELCDVNPSAIHLAVPSGFRTRKTVPEIYRLHRFDLDPGEVGSHEGIPIVAPELA